MFPPYMVDIDLIQSWMDQETEFIIDNKTLSIQVDPSKKVKVPTSSWLPNPEPEDQPQMNNVDRLEQPEFEVTSSFTDLRDMPIESDSDDECVPVDIGVRIEPNRQTNRFQSR